MRLGYKEDLFFEKKKQKNQERIFLNSKHLLFENYVEQDGGCRESLTMKAEDFIEHYKAKQQKNFDDDIVAILRKREGIEFDE